MKKYLSLITLLIGLLVGWFSTYKWFKSKPPVVEQVEVVKYVSSYTPTKPSTTQPKRIALPSYIFASFVEKEYISDTTLVHVKDTVYLEGEQKHYSDSTYDAWVSGIGVSLDSIKTYNTTKYITKTVQQKQGWDFGPLLSTSVGKGIVSATLGANLSIPANKWRFDISGGYNVTALTDKTIMGPMGTITVKYDIF